MGSQLSIFRLLCLILLIANANGGCRCNEEEEPDGCGCFGPINSCILAVLLLSACSCGENNILP